MDANTEKEVLKREQLPDETQEAAEGLTVAPERIRLLEKRLADRYSELRNARERSQWERDKAECFASYHMMEKMKDLPYPGYPNLSSILPRIAVDAFHANVMQSVFGNGFRDLVVPKIMRQEFTRKARRGAQFISYQLEQECDFYNVLDDADKKAEMYGIAYMEPYYVHEQMWETVKIIETITEPAVNPVTGQVDMKERKVTKTKKEKKTTFDGIRISSLPVESILISPFVRDIEQAVATDVVFKTFGLNWDTVLSKSKKDDDGDSYYMAGVAERLRGFVTQKYSSKYDELTRKRMLYDGFYADILLAPETLNLSEAHLWFDIDGDSVKEKITVTFHPESSTVLRVSLSPCRIVELRPRPVDERFYGEGVPQICKPLDLEFEAIHNSRVAAGQWENTTFGFYRAGGRFNPSEITVMPGHFYPVDDPREVNFAQTPQVRSSFFQEEQLLFNYFERLFGISENLQAIAMRGESTATENISINKNAALRFSNPFTRITKSLEKLIGHMWDLNRECAPQEKEFYIVGMGPTPIFDKIYNEDFCSEIEFKLNISTVFDEQLLRDTWALTYRIMRPDPLVQQNPALAYELVTNWLKSMNIRLNVPVPPEAKGLGPMEEHDLIRSNDPVPDPMPGIDVDDHLKAHEFTLKSEDFMDWTPEQRMALVVLIHKEKILQQTLEHANLNQSGQFGGMPSPGANPVKLPGVTATRNPSQHFNTMRVGDSQKSQVNNAQGGNTNAY